MLGRVARVALFFAAIACAPYGKGDAAREARESELRCSDHCKAGTCDNLGHATSIHDVPCTPNYAADVGERCSKHINCARGLHCTEGGWKGRCTADDPARDR